MESTSSAILINRDQFGRLEDDALAEFLKDAARSLHAYRLELREKTRREAGIAAMAAVACALVLALFSGAGQHLWLIGPIAGIIWIGWRTNKRQVAWQAHLLSTVLPELTRGMGDVDYENNGIDPATTTPFERLGLIQKSTQKHLSHLMRGRHRNIGFELVYAELFRRSSGGSKSRARSDSVFNGLLCRIETLAAIPFCVVIQQRRFGIPAAMSKMLESSVTSGLTQIDPGPGEFAEKFEIRAALRSDADFDLVKTLICPSLQQALLELNAQEGALIGDRAAFSAAFLDHDFFLALSRYGKTSIVGLEIERVRPFLDGGVYIFGDEADLQKHLFAVSTDIRIPHRIIDRFVEMG